MERVELGGVGREAVDGCHHAGMVCGRRQPHAWGQLQGRGRLAFAQGLLLLLGEAVVDQGVQVGGQQAAVVLQGDNMSEGAVGFHAFCISFNMLHHIASRITSSTTWPP